MRPAVAAGAMLAVAAWVAAGRWRDEGQPAATADS